MSTLMVTITAQFFRLYSKSWLHYSDLAVHDHVGYKLEFLSDMQFDWRHDPFRPLRLFSRSLETLLSEQHGSKRNVGGRYRYNRT